MKEKQTWVTDIHEHDYTPGIYNGTIKVTNNSFTYTEKKMIKNFWFRSFKFSLFDSIISSTLMQY